MNVKAPIHSIIRLSLNCHVGACDCVKSNLFPTDPIVRQRRVKFKGNKKKNFTEGWVEFHDKRVAKTVAVMLNNTPIGGKKRSYYHDDLWNIKYLSKFRWTHLTEKIGKD